MMLVIIKVNDRARLDHSGRLTYAQTHSSPPHLLSTLKVFVDNSLLKVVITAPVVLFGLITNLLYNPFKVMCHPSLSPSLSPHHTPDPHPPPDPHPHNPPRPTFTTSSRTSA